MSTRATRRLVAANIKGGATKSTTTVQLALALAESGHRPLLIDLDEQTSSSTKLMGLEPSGHRLRQALLEEGGALDSAVEATSWNVDVVAGGPSLKGIEAELQAQFDAYASFKTKLLLDELLQSQPGRWDFVLFDTRPNYGTLTTSAITAAENVLCPVCSGGTLGGLADLMANLDKTRLFNRNVRLFGVVPTMVDRTQVSKLSRELLQDRPDVHIFDGIRTDQSLRKAELIGAPAQEINPKAPSLPDFRRLAEQVEQRLNDMDGELEAAE